MDDMDTALGRQNGSKRGRGASDARSASELAKAKGEGVVERELDATLHRLPLQTDALEREGRWRLSCDIAGSLNESIPTWTWSDLDKNTSTFHLLSSILTDALYPAFNSFSASLPPSEDKYKREEFGVDNPLLDGVEGRDESNESSGSSSDDVERRDDNEGERKDPVFFACIRQRKILAAFRGTISVLK